MYVFLDKGIVAPQATPLTGMAGTVLTILLTGTCPTPPITGGADLVIVGLPATLQRRIGPIPPITAEGGLVTGLLTTTILGGTDPILPTTPGGDLLIGLLAILQRGADPTLLTTGTVTGDHQAAGETVLTPGSTLFHLTIGVSLSA